MLRSIPSDIFTFEIPKNLSTPDMRRMREVCKFFRDHTTFNHEISQLSGRWKVFLNGDTYYFLSGKGHVYELNACAYIEPRPIYLTNKKPIIDIICRQCTTFYIDVDGDYHVSGVDVSGNLGLGSTSPTIIASPLPFVLPTGIKIKTIVAGYNTNFACDIDGNWYGFGKASEGQLTLQNIAYRDVPTLITLPNNKKIADVVTAASITYLKDIDGQWFGCGYNGNGMLGFTSDSSTVSQPVPLSLPNGNRIIKIVAGIRHAFFMDEQGNYYGCGENDNGELGLNHTNVFMVSERVHTPELICLGSDKKITDVVAGNCTTFFKVSDGNWYACGQNYRNQLGVNDYHRNVENPLPVCLSNSKKIVKVFTGGSETVFFDIDGNWHSYGDRGHDNVLKALDMKIDPHHPRILDFDRFEGYVQELQKQSNPSLRM